MLHRITRLFINRNFLWLWLGELISETGDMIFNTVVIIWLVEITSSPGLVSAVFIAEAIPFILLGGLIGAIVDLLNKKTTLIIADINRAVILIPLLLLDPRNIILLYYLVVGAFMLSVFARFSVPAKMVLIKQVVHESKIRRATSISQSTQNAAFLLGPSLGSGLYMAFGPKICVLITLLFYMASATFAWLIRVSRKVEQEKITNCHRLWKDFRKGITYIWDNPVIRRIVIGYIIMMLGGGALNVLEVFFIQENLGLNPDKLGLFLSVHGIGLVGGSLLLGVLTTKWEELRILFLGYILMAGGLLIYSQSYWVLPALFVILIIGLGNGLVNVSSTAFLMSYVQDSRLGRVIATLQSSAYAASLISMSIAGYLGNYLRSSTIFLFFCYRPFYRGSLLLETYQTNVIKGGFDK